MQSLPLKLFLNKSAKPQNGAHNMKWIKYDITTTTKDADMIGEILSEFNISGYEISDRVPLTKRRRKKPCIPIFRLS